MDFLIADTFTDSLSRLSGDEQKSVKTTAFDLQLDPSSPGMRFHKLDRAKDKKFWSVRVSADIRMIVHKTPGSLLLCYVDHHDKAYDWAAKRKLQTHPSTGAAQLVEIRETVQDVFVPRYVEEVASEAVPVKRPLFANVGDETLLGYGVPTEWLADVRAANEESLLQLSDHLPAEAAEALLELATGGKPHTLPTAKIADNPFDHPDARRRFRVMANVEELERALEFPWEKWTVFLHPEQREWVEKDYNGPARVSGSAGTGKTIVALHRAFHLARVNPDSRVLLATFTETLANALRTKLRRLVGGEPRLAERIDVGSLEAVGMRLHRSHVGPAEFASRELVIQLLEDAAKSETAHKFSANFLLAEWEQVVDAWQLGSREEYRDVARLGRRTRLPEEQRSILWSIFEKVQRELDARKQVTRAGLFTRLATALAKAKNRPFDFAVIDEAQDLSVSQLRFLAALGAGRADALFFAGDVGQRIFQQPFSWKSLGVDIRGRSRTLRVNYRTSHQIRMQADRLLGPEVSDADGNKEKRNDAVSVFNGPQPTILALDAEEEEIAAVAAWLSDRVKAGLRPHEIGLFVRSNEQMDRTRGAANRSGIAFKILDDRVETASGHMSLSTMHLAKGLEFRAVAVMAVDDEVIPSQARIAVIGDEADLQEVYESERRLLYVACTRARDHLLVTSGDQPSEFLDDLGKSRPARE